MTARPSSAGSCRRTAPSVQGASREAIKAFSGETPRCAAPAAPMPACMRWARSRISISPRNGPPTRCATRSTSICRPDPIAVLACELVADDFDARFSATARHYRYRILDRRAPLGARPRPRLACAAGARRRRHARGGASAWSAGTISPPSAPAECQASSPVKTLDRLDVAPRRRRDRDRGVGPLVPAQPGALDGRLAQAGGRGQMERGRPRTGALHARDRTACGPVAPAAGFT